MSNIYKDSLPGSGISGQTTVGTSEIKLRSNNVGRLLTGLVIKADTGNAGIVYVGFNGVSTSTGFPLSPGEQIPVSVESTDSIYVIASQADQTVHYIGQ